MLSKCSLADLFNRGSSSSNSHHQPRSLFGAGNDGNASCADSVRKYATEETPLNLSSTNLSVLTCGEDEDMQRNHNENAAASGSSDDDDQAILDQCVKIAWAEKKSAGAKVKISS